MAGIGQPPIGATLAVALMDGRHWATARVTPTDYKSAPSGLDLEEVTYL